MTLDPKNDDVVPPKAGVKTDASNTPKRRTAHVPPSGPSEGEGPLRLGAYRVPNDDECTMSWSRVCEIVAQEDLEELNRHEGCESAYQDWKKPVVREYEDMESYIRQYRLHWDPPVKEETDGEREGMEYFRDHWDEDRCQSIPNDWPYGIPGECGHYVVWCRAPIMSVKMFQTEDTPLGEDDKQKEAIYEAVEKDGIRGLTGSSENPPRRVIGKHAITGARAFNKDKKEEDTVPPKVVGQHAAQTLLEKDEVKTGDENSSEEASKEEAERIAEEAHEWAARHVRAYVIAKWPEDRFETVSELRGTKE